MRRRSAQPPAPPRNYAGAIYGALLAASVIATAGTLGPFPRLQLVTMLLVTGLVFWATHLYTGLVGERLAHHELSWKQIRRAAGHEWPIAGAALPPAAAVAVSPFLGLGPDGTAWLGLCLSVRSALPAATCDVSAG